MTNASPLNKNVVVRSTISILVCALVFSEIMNFQLFFAIKSNFIIIIKKYKKLSKFGCYESQWKKNAIIYKQDMASQMSRAEAQQKRRKNLLLFRKSLNYQDCLDFVKDL
jgi:hypothetical protein